MPECSFLPKTRPRESPALKDTRARLDEAVQAGHISQTADLDATIDLVLGIIVYMGASRQEVSRIPAVIAVIRPGIACTSTS